jgi:hypothetical protein
MQDEELALSSKTLAAFRDSVLSMGSDFEDMKAAKTKIINIYKRFAVNNGKCIGEGTVEGEKLRVREYLEKTVESLKRKLNKDAAAFSTDRTRFSRENAHLTSEINDLRRELHFIQQRNTRVQLDGVSSSGNNQEDGDIEITIEGEHEEGPETDDALFETEEEGEREIEDQRSEMRKLKQQIYLLTSKLSNPTPPPPSKSIKSAAPRPARKTVNV